MYAIIRTGGKQYRVQKGDIINVEKIAGQKEGQKKVVFNQVLMLNDGVKSQVGSPAVKGASVEAEIIENGKLEKVVVFKYKAKKDYRNKQGHRQPYTQVKITDIKAAVSKEAQEAVPAEEAPAEKATKAKTVKKEAVPAEKAVKTKTVNKEAASAEEAPAEKTTKTKTAKKEA